MRGEFGEPADQRPAAGDGRQEQQRRTESGGRRAVLEGADHHLGDEHRLRDEQSGSDGAQGDDRRQEDPGGARVPQKTWIDGFHVKQALLRGGCVSPRFT
ncbi:hypothetical protein SVIOM342S_08595 [Streptomyces violaceorubidus]